MVDPILKLIVAPGDAGDILDLNVVKTHLEVDSNRYDTNIKIWIAAAARQAERLRGEVIAEQTWEMIFESGFPAARSIALKPRPVLIVQSVKYLKDDQEFTFGTLVGSPQEIAELELIRDPINPQLRLRSGESWPSGATEFRIRLVCGEIEPIVEAGMLLMIGHWFENREAVADGQFEEIPIGVRALLARPKVG